MQIQFVGEVGLQCCVWRGFGCFLIVEGKVGGWSAELMIKALF